MPDRTKTGSFIAETRREKGLSEKELSKKLNISEQTVSKWEKGKEIPDRTILPELCHILDINVNELLSGERLSKDDYEKKAEENMMDLVQKAKPEKMGKGICEVILGIAMLIAAYFLAIPGTGSNIAWYIDLPSFLLILFIMLMVLALTHQLSPFFRGFARALGKGNTGEKAMEESFRALTYGGKAATIGAIIVMITGFVAFMGHMSDPGTIGSGLAICLLGIFYGAIYNVIILIFKALLEKRMQN